LYKITEIEYSEIEENRYEASEISLFLLQDYCNLKRGTDTRVRNYSRIQYPPLRSLYYCIVLDNSRLLKNMFVKKYYPIGKIEIYGV